MSVKAFELWSVAEKVTIGERVRVKIESVEYRAKSLYLGTNESFVIEMKYNSLAKRCEDSLRYKYLGLKKPVVTIRAVCILERIICICDSNLIVLNQNDLEVTSYGNKLKNISVLCLNENPNNNNPFSVELCIARRKQLIVYNMTSEKMIAVKEICLSELVQSLSMDGQYICVATDCQYLIVDWETGHIQDVCCSDSQIAVPLSKRITKHEFLISGPSSLGLFVKSTGISERPPIQWSSDIVSIAYSHPYILCLTDSVILIFSVVDQQLKQSISLSGGIYLDNFDGTVLITTSDSVYELRAIPWTKQLQMLLQLNKVKEALDLSHNWREAGLSHENYDKILMKVKRNAAFIELSLKHFDEAKQLFIESNTDIVELIDLYTDCLPPNLKLQTPLKYFVEDFHISIDNQSQDYEEYKIFLLQFLDELHSSDNQEYKSRDLEINSALISLYLNYKNYYKNLLKLLSNSDLRVDSNWVIECLQRSNSYHALALHYSSNEENFPKALDIWINLETKSLLDDNYPGLQCLADFLIRLKDEQLFVKNLDFILERDEKLGASILINRNHTNIELFADNITPHLHRYTEAEQLYLEHLVLKVNIQSEKYHTNLAIKYIELVVELIREFDIQSQQVVELRQKLQVLLKESTLYNTKLVLEKVIKAKLDYESALLFGRLGDHERALTIFVRQLHDYKLAQQYCIELYSANQQLKQRYQLFHTLLGIYLNINQRNGDELVIPALQLMNSEATELDAIKVLHLIPHKWTLSAVQQFLNKAIRQSMHGLRQSLVTKGLATTENSMVKHKTLVSKRHNLLVNENTVCSLCKKSISEPQFIWYPINQLLLHLDCGQTLNITSNQLS